jgi:hypothetical protein
MPVSCLAYSSTLKMEAICFKSRCENLKSKHFVRHCEKGTSSIYLLNFMALRSSKNLGLLYDRWSFFRHLLLGFLTDIVLRREMLAPKRNPHPGGSEAAFLQVPGLPPI